MPIARSLVVLSRSPAEWLSRVTRESGVKQAMARPSLSSKFHTLFSSSSRSLRILLSTELSLPMPNRPSASSALSRPALRISMATEMLAVVPSPRLNSSSPLQGAERAASTR